LSATLASPTTGNARRWGEIFGIFQQGQNVIIQ
jgi:hypothetical protein